MSHETLESPLIILGRELRTSNDVGFETIPPFWGAFYGYGGASQIPGRLSDDIYAVYTNFENEGVNNNGVYSLVIGCLVAADSSGTDGLIIVTVPVSDRVVFPVESGRPDLAGVEWQEIWAMTELGNTYLADFERYSADGSIEISIGVDSEG